MITVYVLDQKNKSLNRALNEDLWRLDYGLQGNKLSLNVTKTRSLLIASYQKQKNFLESGKKLVWKPDGGGLTLPFI